MRRIFLLEHISIPLVIYDNYNKRRRVSQMKLYLSFILIQNHTKKTEKASNQIGEIVVLQVVDNGDICMISPLLF
ncbi:MAG: hypothetical protein NPMRD1_60038 [Nitrosopumilales archaeon]|nr:MAG: hypothetical protein NPMRD1_60038 [Nitrosopumilales archaeon]